MAIQSDVTINGMTGNLYLTIITTQDEPFAGVTKVLVRGFESRETLYKHTAGEIDGNIIAFEQQYEMPIIDKSKPKWAQIYDWLKENHFKDALDVIE